MLVSINLKNMRGKGGCKREIKVGFECGNGSKYGSYRYA